jgi:hypothetical protein
MLHPPSLLKTSSLGYSPAAFNGTRGSCGVGKPPASCVLVYCTVARALLV